MADEPIGRESVVLEARALYRMLGRDGETVESLRSLIAVPPRIERMLRDYAEESPADAWWIERSLQFRSKVLEEFERLVRDGTSKEDSPLPDLPEVEEAEPEPFTDAMLARRRSLQVNHADLVAGSPCEDRASISAHPLA